MPTDQITIRGAREHNLKNVTLSIPRDKLVVFTGLSGSGKSSLAFDTIYAEGQRRYVESLSAYARQFLGQMEKPEGDVEEPAVDCRHGDRGLRLLAFAVRAGRPSALPGMRSRGAAADSRADGGPRREAAQGHARDGPRTGGQGPQGRIQVVDRGRPQVGLRARSSRRKPVRARRGDPGRQEKKLRNA